MNPIPIVLLATVVVVSGVGAQAPTVSVSGTASVRWQPQSSPLQTQTIAVTGSNVLQVPDVGSATITAGLRTAVVVDALPPPNPCSGCWSEASAQLVVAFASAQPIAGVLRLDLSPQCLMGPVFVDVGDDGTWEAGPSGATALLVPVVLSAEPLPVRIDLAAVNFPLGPSVCRSTAAVEFLAQPANLRVESAPCGPVLGASLTRDSGAPPSSPRRLELTVHGSQGVFGGLLLGAPLGAVPTPCAFLPTFDVVQIWFPAPTQPVVLPVPNALVGTAGLQFAELVLPQQVALSNALALDLP